jgi:3-mercaptopyruvate sulfurtransferase SseA
MSARAAWRLETLGFSAVYRYVAGKIDWLAAGQPTEGEAANEPRIGSLTARDVPTCRPGQRVGEIDADLCVVVNDRGVILGDLRGKALEGDPNAPVEDAMNPAPSTFRPYVSVHAMAHHMARTDANQVLVSTADGRLVGLLRREDVDRALEGEHAGGPVLANQ